VSELREPMGQGTPGGSRVSLRADTTFVLAGVFLLLALSSCAYYNTFYLAKRYYDRAAGGAPYVLEKADVASATNFGKSIDYSKKLLALHPRSKWVDDAYLLWARALMGREDPTQTMNMLRDFAARYPQSPLKDEALFYLGVGGRKARKYADARSALEEFLSRQPKHELAPYAYMELARVLVAIERPGEGTEAVTRMLERFPGHKERDRALNLRAEALLAAGDHARARTDYQQLGTRAQSDEERFTLLLKEADCLERGRLYADELALLRDAISHEQEPQRQTAAAPTTTPGTPPQGAVPQVTQNVPLTGSPERWGKLILRIGTVHTLESRKDDALAAYRRVLDGFPQSVLAAEAQYRVAYTLETVADDLDRAREEYGRVSKLSATSPFSVQASQRLVNLDRLAQFRTGGGTDSLEKKAEAGFMLAELYLFQSEKPDRALEEYQKIVETFPGTPYAGKALNAQAWVLRRKLDRATEADSLLWAVVHGYPKTEAQIHARDYLEALGHFVADSLIQPPDAPPPPPPDTLRLTPPPAVTDSLGPRRPVVMSADSLMRIPFIRAGDTVPTPSVPRPGLEDRRPPTPPDSTRVPAPVDTARTQTPTPPAAPDTTRKREEP